MYYIKKTFKISASHSLDLPYQSPCTNVHGHNYKITVHVKRAGLNSEGMVMDFTDLKKIVFELDHCHLNDKIAQTTAEHMAEYILKRVNNELLSRQEFNHPECYRVEVEETEGSVAIYEI